MDLNEIKKVIEVSYSIHDCSLKVYGYQNGRVNRKLLTIINENGIDISHFGKGEKQRKYEVISKDCPICGTNFETKKGSKKEKSTCGKTSCSNKFRGKRSAETKQKIRDTLKYGYNNELYDVPNVTITKRVCVIRVCVICETTYKPKRTKSGKFSRSKTCSKECRHQHLSKVQRDNQLKLIAEGRHKGWQSRNKLSYPEKFFKKVLELNGFKGKFEINKMIKKRDLGLDCNSSYFLDFYFEDIKFDLEIDGSQHELIERKESDKRRDIALINNGIDVYRIKWKSINTEKGKTYMKEEIDKLIKILNNSLK